MAEAEHLLRWDETVGHHAYYAGHDKRHYALHGVEPEDVVAETHGV